MSEEEVISLKLNYGCSGVLRIELLERQMLSHRAAPAHLEDVSLATSQGVAEPLDFPSFDQAFLPDDRVAVVIERETPQADRVFAAVWDRIRLSGLQPQNVTILQPAAWKTRETLDPRRTLPEEIREKMPLVRHDPMIDGSCVYLASTAAGERVYMARPIADADVVMTIGPGEFDPLLGVRGGASSLYPGLSDLDALQRAQGEGHEELGPRDVRPFRQIVDEIGWLLGLQMSVVTIPAAGTEVHQVLAGQADSVLRRTRELLDENWFVREEERAELVLVTVTQDGGGHGWEQVAAALEAGRRLVERNGRIVVLSEIDELPGPGLEILKTVREPRDALKAIRRSQTPDLLAASRVAAAVDWANVSILSKLDPAVISDLFMLPLENEREVQRLLEAEDLTTIVESAQHVFVQSGV